MLASAVRTYLNRFSVSVGRRVVVFTTTDDGWKTALDLHAAKIRVEGIVDARPEVDAALVSAAQRIDTRVFLGAAVIGTVGLRTVHGVTVRDVNGRLSKLRADALAVSGGWNPNIALATHLGGRPHWERSCSAFLSAQEAGGMTIVGAARGSFSLADALREGAAAGVDAAETTGHRAPPWKEVRTDGELIASTPLWYVPRSKGKAFVDFQHDVTIEDVRLAVREGFRCAEHLKRYTTLGMGTDQGRTSNVNGLAILAELTGRAMTEVGTTTSRPPYVPIAIAALAGNHRGKNFRPVRLTPGHQWAQEQGATFVEAGQWLRAQWFGAPTERGGLETVIGEVTATRSRVGVCDVSTLGKIDIQGRDAGTFLDRVYINMFSTLPVGKVRYGVMLREDGFVLDDGTIARFAPNHYLMSTTTANAERVMRHLEYARQVLWPELDVQTTSVTEQWAQYSIAGPYARDVLQRLLGTALDVSHDAFPYLACARLSWNGIPARVFRISFSGELGYEFAVPARYGDATIRAITDAGAMWGIVPYGTEALGVMRIEKGHVAGNELNGTTTAADLGLGRMMSAKKDFIGRVLATREGLVDPTRPSLVGVRPVAREARLHAGAHFLARGTHVAPKNDEGYITSVAYSPMLRHWIGLGLLKCGVQRHGDLIRAYDPLHNSQQEVEVVSPIFFDKEGARLLE